MLRLSELGPEDLAGGIRLIDLGASGDIPPYWRRLARLIRLIGFDPNGAECARLNQAVSGFLSQQFLPYAIAGESRTFTLHKTKSIYCWSLLEPNLPWLRRFQFSDHFEVEGTEPIAAVTLEDVPELADLEIDAVKVDTQGLELPILRAAERIVRDCILVETETGFTENYLGETTFDQIAQFMRGQGFGLFAINTNHHIPRKNALAAEKAHEQILWCEAVWLRDYSRAEARESAAGFTRAKALKALAIYANHGCYAFGLECAARFQEWGHLTAEEVSHLASGPAAWRLPGEESPSPRRDALTSLLRLVPRRFHRGIATRLNDLKNERRP